MAASEARRAYLRAYQRAWIAKRRADWMADKRCADCGGTESLEVHHLDPAQKVSHRIWSWSVSRRDAELAGCIVLCARCHDRRHASAAPHGTRTRYTAHGCRCEACCEAARAYWREQNSRRKR